MREQGFEKVVFIIMHGGDNFYGIKLALDECYGQNPDISAAVTTAGYLLGAEARDLLGPGLDIDTSIMLHIKPELVHMEKIEDAREDRPQPETKGRAVRYEQGKDLAYYRPDNTRDVSKSSAELGEKLLGIISDNLVEIIQSLE
jgi:creatinine amidohydrolase/Fe(II)-dependent formamide hydrolase-like protein